MQERSSPSQDWSEGRFLAFLIDVWSFLRYTFRRFMADRLSQAAGALTYSTLLALVPLLVIAFSILSSFPAFDAFRGKIEETVFSVVVPEVGGEVRDYLKDFTKGAQNLPAVGTVALAVTAVLLLSTIESTLNRIWRVENPRPLHLRLLVFWAILTLGPLLLGASFTLTGNAFVTLRDWSGAGGLLDGGEDSFRWLGKIAAVLTQAVTFAILFKIVPARRVRLRHAAIGGLLSGIAFEVLRWGFNEFLTSGSTYQTIYGAVAIFPLFLIWVYGSWTVIILGAVVAAALPDWWQTRDPLLGFRLTPRQRLAIAVAVLVTLDRQAQKGGGVTQEELVQAVPVDARDEIADALCHLGYAVVTENGDISLARDLHTTRLSDLVRDLGLSLGTSEGPLPRSTAQRAADVFDKIGARTGMLPDVLRRLAAAEGEILDIPLADLGTMPEAQPGPTGVVTTSA